MGKMVLQHGESGADHYGVRDGVSWGNGTGAQENRWNGARRVVQWSLECVGRRAGRRYHDIYSVVYKRICVWCRRIK